LRVVQNEIKECIFGIDDHGEILKRVLRDTYETSLTAPE